MKESTRKRKERLMLKAAGRVIQKKGLTNFTMEEVADEAYVTKVTLYTYFTSKENLTMAVSHSIFNDIMERVNQIENSIQIHDGLDACLRLESEILNFVSEKPFRAVPLLEFLSIYKVPESKLSVAMANSPYRLELNKLASKIANTLTEYIDKGKADGSIQNKNDTETLFFYIWNCISGFIALASTYDVHKGDSVINSLNLLANFHENSTRQILIR